jgi:hypothetical protein
MDSYVTRRYGPCDSYFIETDEISTAERLREQRRAIIKIRQRELAAELSAVTADEYLEEVLDHMEHMEVSRSRIGWTKVDGSGNYNARRKLHGHSA